MLRSEKWVFLNLAGTSVPIWLVWPFLTIIFPPIWILDYLLNSHDIRCLEHRGIFDDEFGCD